MTCKDQSSEKFSTKFAVKWEINAGVDGTVGISYPGYFQLDFRRKWVYLIKPDEPKVVIDENWKPGQYKHHTIFCRIIFLTGEVMKFNGDCFDIKKNKKQNKNKNKKVRINDQCGSFTPIKYFYF